MTLLKAYQRLVGTTGVSGRTGENLKLVGICTEAAATVQTTVAPLRQGAGTGRCRAFSTYDPQDPSPLRGTLGSSLERNVTLFGLLTFWRVDGPRPGPGKRYPGVTCKGKCGHRGGQGRLAWPEKGEVREEEQLGSE